MILICNCLKRLAPGVAIAGLVLACGSAKAVVVEGEFQVPAEAFDQWVFQKVGTRRQARTHLIDLLELKVAAVDRACKLTEAQQRKLMLAGKIDIRQLFDRIETIRDDFLAVRRDQEAFNKAQIWQRTAPLQSVVMGGVYDAESLYQKVLASTLDDEQRAAWQQVEQQRRRYAYEAKIRMTLVALERTLPLSDEQRAELVELLLRQTPPLLRTGDYEQYYILYQCGQLDLRDLARLLTLPQLQVLHRRVHDFPEAERAFLEKQNLLPESQGEPDAEGASMPLAAADDAALRQAVERVGSEAITP